MADSEHATEIFVNAWAAYQKLLKVIQSVHIGVGERLFVTYCCYGHACTLYIKRLFMTQNDYLSHLVLYGGLTEALKSFKDGEQFQLLDLGCGDAHYIADALQRSGAGSRLRQYTGVDLAGDALKVRVVGPAAR